MTKDATRLMRDALLEQLTPSQRQAVTHIEGPLLVIAGPGSGKTRVITHRIAALIESGIAPYRICAITFTNKAAQEMRRRALALGASGGAHISTFHSLCVRILRTYAEQAGIRASFSIYDASDQKACIKQALKQCELDTTNFPPGRMLDAISTLKNKCIDPQAFRAQAEDFFSRTLVQVYECYQAILAERNSLDFDDLLMFTASLLEANSSVCDELGRRFRYLLIDEYQDTNHAQYRIAKALVSAHDNICATGDPDQSIYRWRGADIRNILAFEHDWPDGTIVKLEENFRSSANILSVADSLIAHNKGRKQKRLVPTRPREREVVVTAREDAVDEARIVAGQIKRLIESGAGASEIAVFYRVNAMSRALEEALIAQKIPYQIVRGIEFYNRKEIRDLLAYLRVLVNPDDEVALLRIINTPARGIGKVTIDKVRTYASRHNISILLALRHLERIESIAKATKGKLAAFVKLLKDCSLETEGPVAPVAERIFAESGLAESLAAAAQQGRDATENVRELINAMARYDSQSEKPSLLDYIQQISLFSDTDVYDPSAQRIAMMTLHAAKGLEFEHVFIVGVEEGLLPHERAGHDDQQLEEERRLLFVGITRAKTGLHISYARYRNIRGQLLRTMPSQFLFELGCDMTEVAQGSDACATELTLSFQSGEAFVPGEMVRHKSFGLGRVERFLDMGENSVVEVRFNTGVTKTLMVKSAQLSRE